MAGIEDLMNIRTQGGTANVPPMGGPPGMGGPPQGMPPAMGGAPMGGPPPQQMGGGPMMGGQDPMMGGQAAMGGQPMEEPQMDMEQDSVMLAEAVVGRTQGDIGAAIAVLDNAKAMLIQSVDQGGGQDPMMANMGRPIMRNMGGPMYRQDGGSMSQDDVLRQMIMENLQKPEVQEQALASVMGMPKKYQNDTFGPQTSSVDRDAAMERMMKFRSA
tara:strand:- start:1204 stop:1848 length:645 start_codon:yes stop_codon:yes gene_type:complete